MKNRTFCILHCLKSSPYESLTGIEHGDLTDICYVLIEEKTLKVTIKQLNYVQ